MVKLNTHSVCRSGIREALIIVKQKVLPKKNGPLSVAGRTKKSPPGGFFSKDYCLKGKWQDFREEGRCGRKYSSLLSSPSFSKDVDSTFRKSNWPKSGYAVPSNSMPTRSFSLFLNCSIASEGNCRISSPLSLAVIFTTTFSELLSMENWRFVPILSKRA